MIFCLIVLMVFSEQVETNEIGIFMIIFPSIVLLPSWYAAEKQFATAENDFGDNNKNTDKLSVPNVASIGSLSRIIDAYQNDQIELAYKHVIQVIRLRPFHPEAYLQLIEIILSKNDNNSAYIISKAQNDFTPEWSTANNIYKRLTEIKTGIKSTLHTRFP